MRCNYSPDMALGCVCVCVCNYSPAMALGCVCELFVTIPTLLVPLSSQVSLPYAMGECGTSAS